MGGVGYFSAVSNVVQHMLAEVFNDEPFMEHYFAENSQRLGAAYAEFAGELTLRAKLQHLPDSLRYIAQPGCMPSLGGCHACRQQTTQERG
jgi:hypothetical protein